MRPLLSLAQEKTVVSLKLNLTTNIFWFRFDCYASGSILITSIDCELLRSEVESGLLSGVGVERTQRTGMNGKVNCSQRSW